MLPFSLDSVNVYDDVTGFNIKSCMSINVIGAFRDAGAAGGFEDSVRGRRGQLPETVLWTRWDRNNSPADG